MRLTLVGPAFPWRGGIPLLTTDLAHRLTAEGHDVVLRTWSRQGPARLLPAQRYPLAAPESRTYPTAPEQASDKWLGGGAQGGVAQALANTAKFLMEQKRITEMPADFGKFVNPEFAAAAAK